MLEIRDYLQLYFIEEFLQASATAEGTGEECWSGGARSHVSQMGGSYETPGLHQWNSLSDFLAHFYWHVETSKNQLVSLSLSKTGSKPCQMRALVLFAWVMLHLTK